MKKMDLIYSQDAIRIPGRWISRVLLIKLAFILLCSLPALARDSQSKDFLETPVSISSESAKLKNVLNDIESQISTSFVYSSNTIKADRLVSVKMINQPLKDVLHAVFSPLNLSYKILAGKIIVENQGEAKAILTAINKVVKGTVKDDTGATVAGVTVLIKGTNTGTSSDADGNFELTVPDNAILTFSMVGFNVREVTVGNQSIINITLESDISILDEVVVIGYGAVKKKDLTGSVVQLKSEQLKEVPAANVLEAAQGRIAGADITKSSGQAGAGVSIRLRGNRSIGGNNSPLIVVDGIQYNNLEDINPNDIETMDILKDASSTAIYGSRGANGVILITTKKGKTGKPDISFNTYTGVSQVSMYPKAMDAYEYRDLRREAWRAVGLWNSPADDINIFSNLPEYEALQRGEWTDFQKELIHNGLQQNYQIGLRAGTEKLKSYVSLDYFNEKGVLKMDEMKRYTARVNVDYSIFKWLNTGFQSQITYYDQSIRRDPLNQANKISPIGLLYDAEGNFNYIMLDGQTASPLADEQPNVYNNSLRTTRVLTNGFVEFLPFKGLSIRSTLGVNLGSSRNGIYSSPRSIERSLSGTSLATYNAGNGRSINWENVAIYQKSLGIHSFTLTGIASIIKNASDNVTASGVNQLLPSQLFYSLGSATEEIKINSAYSANALVSYAARVNYSLLDRYLLTVTARQDGSSKLAVGNKWTFFPSAAFAWRIIDENFMKNTNKLSDLKLRVSYGVAGNDPSGPYATQSTLTRIAFGYDDVAYPAYTFSRNVGNLALGWELSRTNNIGIDFGFFNNRVTGSIDYYDTKTTDLLLDRGLPPSTGVTTVKQNIGKTRNRGLEITLGSTNLRTENFTWSSYLTFTRNREEITELASGGDDIGNGWFIGHPIEVYFDYQKLGIWQTNEAEQAKAMNPTQLPGEIKVKDQNGDGVIDAVNDRVILGTPRPSWSGGLDNNFKYKNFDLSISIFARIGQMIKADTYARYDARGVANSTAGMDYWTPENPTNDYPRPNRNGGLKYLTTLPYVDGSFVRVRNVSLGYNIPGSMLKTNAIKNIRVYATAKNLYTFTKLNYDPERGGSENFPMTKLFVFGLNCNF